MRNTCSSSTRSAPSPFGLLLAFLTIVAMPAAVLLAGPASSDLPDVKMPPVATDHPRLVFRPEGKGPWTFAHLRQLYETQAQPADQATSLRNILKPWLDQPVEKDPSPAASALRYRLTGDEKAAERAINQLLSRPTEDIGSEYYSNGWEYALAYDWLYDHPSITPQKRQEIEKYLVANAKRAIELLNDDGWELCPSLWHGRTKITNLGLIVCLGLDTAPETAELRSQIARFFGDACRALRLSEGWPEGYAYWLGNRSFPFALAVDCWQTATGTIEVGGIDLAEMIRRTDLWHVYGQGPDDRFLLYGDVFQGVRMDYSWRAQTMDYYARITGDPYLQAFALNGHLKAKNPYNGQYRWIAALAFNPTIKLPSSSTPADPLAGLKDLPLSDLFGPGSYNLAIFRTGWTPADTQISFKAGDVQVHHAHYDAGDFTIYKGAPLAVNSGTYAGFGSTHRQMYYIQSVAANCPLVLMPGEHLETTEHYDGPFTGSGGQRVVLPQGSAITSAASWRRDSQPGKIFAAGKLLAYAWESGQFGYVAADLTNAYNSEAFSSPGQQPKLRQATRALLYLPQPETVIVYDRIIAAAPQYQKKWLLHTINKPDLAQTTLLKGTSDNGILESPAKDATVTNKTGTMHMHALLPEASRWLLIGGDDYRFYIETDGDQTNGFNGQNPTEGFNKAGYFDTGNWRLELEPTTPAQSDDFLVAMSLGTTDTPPSHTAHLVGQSQDKNTLACQVGPTVVIFAHTADQTTSAALTITPTDPVSRIIVCTLTQPKAIPTENFAPVQPDRRATATQFSTPLPAGRPAAINITIQKGNPTNISPAR